MTSLENLKAWSGRTHPPPPLRLWRLNFMLNAKETHLMTRYQGNSLGLTVSPLTPLVPLPTQPPQTSHIPQIEPWTWSHSKDSSPKCQSPKFTPCYHWPSEHPLLSFKPTKLPSRHQRPSQPCFLNSLLNSPVRALFCQPILSAGPQLTSPLY